MNQLITANLLESGNFNNMRNCARNHHFYRCNLRWLLQDMAQSQSLRSPC
jgi:hypothetical protein